MNKIQLHVPLIVSQSRRVLTPTDPFRTVKWQGLKRIPLQSQQTESFYLLKTRSRFETVLRYWKVLDIFKGLDLNLEEALWTVPGIQRDTVYWALKRAKNYLLLRKNGERESSNSNEQQSIPQFLLERIQRAQSKLGLPLWSWNFLYALENQFQYELTLNFRETRKVKKYSGYIRTPSALGSKRKTSIGGIEFIDEKETEELKIEEENILDFLLSPTEDYSLLEELLGANFPFTIWKSQKERRAYIHQKLSNALGPLGPGAIFDLS